MDKQEKRILIFLIGICVWIVYIYQNELAHYGIYTVLSYEMHEIASVIPFVLFGTAAIWCGYLIVKKKKGKADRQDLIFAGLLLVIALFLGRFIYQNSVSLVVVCASIESVNEQENLIVIKDESGRTVTLESPQIINSLLETDGREYVVEYEWNKTASDPGRVCKISLIK